MMFEVSGGSRSKALSLSTLTSSNRCFVFLNLNWKYCTNLNISICIIDTLLHVICMELRFIVNSSDINKIIYMDEYTMPRAKLFHFHVVVEFLTKHSVLLGSIVIVIKYALCYINQIHFWYYTNFSCLNVFKWLFIACRLTFDSKKYLSRSFSIRIKIRFHFINCY